MQHSRDLSLRLVDEISALVPEFLKDPIDFGMSDGNAACVVIDPDGNISGKIFGNDHNRGRGIFGIVQRKATQVWCTGYATGRFEELVYSRQLDDTPFGIIRPDFIGWEGGIPLLLEDGRLWAAAFSGFRGENDIAIIQMAVGRIKELRLKKD